ncbi:RAD55 family ATPase [Halosegnis marinus]|uniref:RAD55 family ATPase n=1 Tax=Halosegnis marinus TaxID=3034023 RepID=A0ABD5ZQV5_9EURY|nr:recombinase RecA [Halosegnis sp. DT85]
MYDLGGPLDGSEVAPGTNLLLSGPPLSGKTAVGYELLEAGARRGEGALVVSNKHSAERVRAEHPDLFEYDVPVGIVDCVTKHQGQGTIADTDLVQYASSPEDMTGIGIKFSELLEQFYSRQGVTRNRALFVSVSTLLMYSDLQTVFRFLHVFTSRIENADALGLFVIQSEAHDAQTMNTLSQLFDGVIETDEEGELTANLP